MDCNEVLQQLADYLDEDARVELCRQIETHLSQCHDCQLKVDSLKKTIVLYQAGTEKHEIPVRVASKLDAVLAREYERRAKSPD